MSSWEKKSKAEARKKRDKERKAKFAAAWEKTKEENNGELLSDNQGRV